LFGGFILPLHAATDWDYPPVKMIATVYGYGECQPNFQTANGEIFHTMDLTLAVPYSHYGTKKWARNQWVKVGFRPTGRTVRARLTDVCGCDHVDLSRGVARSLKMQGTGKVTVSRP
jgi:rare lipoprotein A (peptidoglycan hydrolase)